MRFALLLLICLGGACALVARPQDLIPTGPIYCEPKHEDLWHCRDRNEDLWVCSFLVGRWSCWKTN